MKNTSYLSCHNELVMAAFREKRCSMNLQALKYIIEIEKYGSISRAAENLHLSQPYLSKIVKEMENEFQISLFTRSKRGITLTESGRLFINMGKDLQRNIDNFQSMFHSHLEYEQLRISSRTCSHPFDAFVRMLQEMEGKKLRCVFRETTNDQVISDIYTNAADVGVLLLDRGNWKDVARILEIKRIACRRLCSSRGYLLARSGHPLLSLGQPVQGADIYRYNFVLYESQSWSNYNLVGDTHLSETAELLDWDRVQQVVYVTSRAALHDILLRTDYLSFGLLDVRGQEDNMGLATFPIPEDLIGDRPESGNFFCYIYLKNRELSPICKRFIQCLKKYYGCLSEIPFPADYEG